jgi:hypothetical protein
MGDPGAGYQAVSAAGASAIAAGDPSPTGKRVCPGDSQPFFRTQTCV